MTVLLVRRSCPPNQQASLSKEGCEGNLKKEENREFTNYSIWEDL